MKIKNLLSAIGTKLSAVKSKLAPFVDPALDVALAITMLGPALTMLLGFKAIPNIVASSVSSVLFAYLWVGLLAVGGFALLLYVILHRSKPVFALAAMNTAFLGIIFGAIIYGLSAWAAFGFLSAQVTLGVCFGLATVVLARWIQTRRVQRLLRER